MSTSLIAALGARYPDSSVLFHNDFNNGLGGRCSLYETGTTTPHPGPTLCNYPTWGNSAFSCRYGTGNVGSGTQKDGLASTARRTTLPATTGTITYEVQWAWGSQLGPLSPLFYEFWFDIQAWDGSSRSNYIFRWYNRDPSTGASRTQWAILDDTQSVVWVPNATVAHPFNEDKFNWNYLKFVADITGGYRTLTAGGQTFDLSALGAGTGAISTVTNFNGGLNFMVGLSNRSASSIGQAWGFLGWERASYAA